MHKKRVCMSEKEREAGAEKKGEKERE